MTEVAVLQRFGFAIKRMVIGVIHRVGIWFLVATADRKVTGTPPIAVLSTADNVDLVLKVQGALRLIESVKPGLHRRVSTYIAHIVVISQDLRDASAQYWHGSKTCILTPTLARDRSEAVIAAAIVHEAAHARLEAAGIRYYRALRSRIEAACTRDEIDFAKLLPLDRYPGTERYVAHLQERYAAYDAPSAA